MRPAFVLFALSVCAVLAADPTAVGQPKAVTIKLNKLSAPAPAGWVSEKPKYTLRSYQFQLPGEKENPPGEVIVMPDSNPKAEKVFPGWKASFDGEPVVKESKLEVKGAAVRLLDVTGTWRYKERPFDKTSKTEERPDYRVVWAVIAEADEATHVRLSGPKAVVDRQYPAFEAWLKALK
ncbi:MAG: hypothetical protein U0804_01925 [Gemmataceae bacterium]